MSDISVMILTKDSEQTIKNTLESLREFKEVIVLDTGSKDQTRDIVSTFPNAKWYEHPFSGFGIMRNIATSYVTSPWILSLDSDEVLPPETSQLILSKDLQPSKVYSFPFHNYFNDQWIKWCGWYPDRHIRLYPKEKAGFSSDFVHEKVLYEGLEEEKLEVPIEHYSYRTIGDFLEKMHKYSTLFAEQNRYKQSSSLGKAIFHGCFAFIKSYVMQRGCLGGKEGFMIAMYNSQVSYYKYLKLWEANRDASCL